MKTTKCKACGKEIVFLKTRKGTYMPVDADSYTFGKSFEPKLFGHVSHFATCPEADKFREKKEKSSEGVKEAKQQ